MVLAEFLNDGTLIKHYSDKGLMLLQVETGVKYADPVDVVPCRYTYTETDEPIEEEEEVTGNELEELILGYTTGTATCAATYDFDKNERCFCTERIENIPAEHIF